MSTRTDAVRRAVGLFVPRHSELRRNSDRAEVTARWVLLIVGLLFLPVALTVGSEVTARLAPQVTIQQAERHQVTAEVLAAPDLRTSARPDTVSEDFRAPVRWTAADGTSHVAVVRVPASAEPGEARTLWVDRADRPAPAPMSPTSPAAQGALTTVFLVLADLVLSLLLLAGLRWVLDRARLRAWDAAWRRFTGPDHESTR
ncbi:hypothetical protein PHK61_13995 [Actinomycetospora lutea]|uniref:Rv1733c family protein n=1 Tax=Actinomycetospora lutea TaxID=663604 RepID=UPI002366095F|nr:hypothetical protein [Actinomycetospora lutea]MDD7939531.1 hypothetical protein [Actinomycetospora lutea]